MTAVLPLNAEELELIRIHGLSLGQIAWRRQKQQELRRRFPEQYPESDVDCFLASGGQRFDVDALKALAAKAQGLAPEIVPTLPRSRGRDLAVAPARLMVWSRPAVNRSYVIGADVGEGIEGRDASAACVLDRRSGEQVAELHGWVAPDRFALLLSGVGRWYRMAQLAVERNNHGHSTLNTLRNVCRYPRLYRHVRYDAGKKAVAILGWPTDVQTRPILIDDLAAAIAGQHIGIRSAGLLDECMSFIVTDRGDGEAAPDAHDDRVIAAGIAWQVRKRGSRQLGGDTEEQRS